MNKLAQAFRHFAEATARFTGRPVAFLGAVAVIVLWAASGPVFHFGDTWQLVINTCTTIITFLMVFLIQNSQNRDSAALQIKLDELIRATEAYNGLLEVDDLDEDAMERIRETYRKLGKRRKHDGAPTTQGQKAAKPGSSPGADEGKDEEDVKEIKDEMDRSKARAASESGSPAESKPKS